MAIPIQRFPKGLAEILAIYGVSPQLELSNTVIGQLELLQFLGLSQLVTLTTNAPTLGEGSFVTVVPSADRWSILFAAGLTYAKTATVTALRAQIITNRVGTTNTVVASEDQSPFGATETGSPTLVWIPPYPWIMPPGSGISGSFPIIGTDANVNASIRVEVGVLG